MYIHPKVRYNDPAAERKNSIIRYIGTRVLKSNKNFLCAITGQTGSGKSWATGSIQEMYSKLYGIPYDVEKHFVFSLKDFLNIINKKEEYKIGVGSTIAFDESQVDVNARGWQSKANKIMSSLVSTFRNQRLVVFFPTPKLEFLDRQTRILFHAEFKVQSFDRNKRITTLIPRILTDFNHKKDDFYRKRLIVEHALPNKRYYGKYMVNKWDIPAPSKEWIVKYEAKKKTFTDMLNKQLLEDSKKEFNPDKKEVESRGTFDKALDLYNRYEGNFLKIYKEMPDISPHTLERWLRIIKKNANSGIIAPPMA